MSLRCLYLVWTWEAVYKSHQESNNRKCKKLHQEEVTVRKLFHSKSCYIKFHKWFTLDGRKNPIKQYGTREWKFWFVHGWDINDFPY